MAFNIHERVFDSDGMPIEKKAGQYGDQLMRLFVESPEAKALEEEGLEPGWANMMLDFGINYLNVTPPQMSASHLREILFELIPRKVSAPADEAPDIVRELRAFWQFLQREFHLENAAACLGVLDDKAARELKKEMSDPANFGIAKSMVMMGMARGFDMSTEAGLNEWMATYNAEVAAGSGLRIPFPGERSESARKFRGKLKRRMGQESRKKNRRKK